MKITNYLLIVLTASVLALVGCGKSADKNPPPRQPGVVDLTELQKAFPTPTPEIQASMDKIRFALRYRSFPAGLAELETLAKIATLTEPQKKAVADAIEQFKVAIQTTPAAPPQ